MLRGGDNFSYEDVYPIQEHNDFGIERCLNYINFQRVRELLAGSYRYKKRGVIIYITEAILCVVIKRFENHVLIDLAFPILNINIVGFTSALELAQKIVISSLIGAGGLALYTNSLPGIIFYFAIILCLNKSNLNTIDHTLIGWNEIIEQQVLDNSKVVSVKLLDYPKHSSDKIKMPKPNECMLPDQQLINSNGQLPEDVLNQNSIDFEKTYNKFSLSYDEVVNVEDVGVNRVIKSEFKDKYQIIGKPNKVKPKAKLVQWSDKFPDSKNVPETESWNIEENSIDQTSNIDNIIPY